MFDTLKIGNFLISKSVFAKKFKKKLRSVSVTDRVRRSDTGITNQRLIIRDIYLSAELSFLYILLIAIYIESDCGTTAPSTA